MPYAIICMLPGGMEHSSSMVECRICNRGSPGSNTPFATVPSLGIFVLSTMPQFAQLYK